jgi:predicted transcriptional regulator
MFLLAKPDNWQVRPEQVAEECGSSRSTVYRLLAKLIEAGYIRRDDIRRRKSDGTFDSAALYTVFEDRKMEELYGGKVPF